ncbi:MAG TPA: hypothetical protein VHM48_06555, partial [Candidatus Limnocylindrales bacterium]|nr:hypothetical protein [Candidatus Limnocylindrales bacterium]
MNCRTDGRAEIVPVVESYPAPPLAETSRDHRVRVLHQRVFVERYADVSYARFAMRGPVTVEIEVESPIASHTIFPAERVAAPSVDGNV